MSDLLARIKSVLTPDEIAYLTLPATPPSTDILVPGVSNRYPTIDSWNCDCTRMLLEYPNGFVGLFTDDGTLIRRLPQISTSSDAVWHRTDPRTIFFVERNAVKRLIIGATEALDVITIPRMFSWYVPLATGDRNGVSMKGEEDLSDDGNFLAFCGTKPDKTEWVFRLDLRSGTTSSAINIPLLPPGTSAFDNIYMTPDNNVLIGYYTRGFGRFMGVEMFDKNMTFVRQITSYAAPHMDTLRNAAGDECIVTSDDSSPAPVMIRLADGLKTHFPVYGDWTQATHYSAPMGKSWFLVESYDPGTPDSPLPLNNAIHKYGLDGSRVTLRKHGASAVDYEDQPKTSVSHDGSRFVYTVRKTAVIVKL